MQLLPQEQKRLDVIAGSLRAEVPRLAAKFDMFTRLAGGEGQPPAEKQFRAKGRWWRYKALARQRALRLYCIVFALVMVALVVVLILELS